MNPQTKEPQYQFLLDQENNGELERFRVDERPGLAR